MRVLYFFICLVGWVGLNAQSSTLHLDRPYYVSGDFLFYSVGSPFFHEDTISLQVELFNNDRLVNSHFKLLYNGVGKGWIKLPFELPSGKYDLSISVFETESFSKNLIARQDIAVYRPSDKAALAKEVKDFSRVSREISEEIGLDRTKIGYREDVDFKFVLPESLRGKMSHVSVSVRDQDIYQGRDSHFQDESTRPLMESISGIPFHGNRILEDRGKISNPLLFAFNATDLTIDATQVDREDNFTFELSPFTGKRRITFIDYLDREFSIGTRKSPLRPIVAEDLHVDSDIIDHLTMVEQQRKINQRFKYFDLKPQEIAVSDSLPLEPNYFVDVQDFDIRGTTVSLFKELISPLKFKSIGKGEYRARMLYERNDIKKFYSRPPMFIVNDAATRNGPFVAKFPLQEVKNFHIFSLYDQLEEISPIAFGGLVYVDMMDRNYVLDQSQALPSVHLEGLQRELVYPIAPAFEPGVPATSSLLYWNPSVPMVDGALQLIFSSVDISTRYTVEVVVHLDDGTAEAFYQQLEVSPNR